jgi:phosphate transport system permease protein
LGAGTWSDPALRWLTAGAALTLVAMLVGLLIVLAQASWPTLRSQGLGFVTGREWLPGGRALLDADGNPKYDADGEVMRSAPVFGALPVIWGTAASSAIALALAVPVSMGAALFLVRAAPRRLAAPVAFMIEFLAAIPSLAYGLWGYAVLGPFLQRSVETWAQRAPGLGWMFWANGRALAPTGVDLLTAGVLLSIMIVPIITALSRDILTAVPRAQVEGTTALGATWWQTSVEMLRYSRSGLFGAIMLGLARAAGETIAVTLVIGNVKQILPTPFAPAQTMASLLANEFGEAASSAEHRGALWGVAMLLLVMSLAFNVVARYLFVGKDSRTAGGH